MPNDAREAIACAIREAFNEGDLWYDEEGTHGDDVVARRILALLADRDGVIEEAAKYLVWSNEHRAWWAPDERGYTRRIERAGRYGRAQAIKIAGTRGGGWPIEGNPYEIAILEADAIAQSRVTPLEGGAR